MQSLMLIIEYFGLSILQIHCWIVPWTPFCWVASQDWLWTMSCGQKLCESLLNLSIYLSEQIFKSLSQPLTVMINPYNDDCSIKFDP